MNQAIKFLNDDNDFLELDSAEDRDLIYENLEDEARLDPKAAADAEKNGDESESWNFFEIEDKILFIGPSVRCEVRADIYSQMTLILINGFQNF